MAARGDIIEETNGEKGRNARGCVPCPKCATPLPIDTIKRPVALKCHNCDGSDWILIYNKVSKR